MQDDFPKSFKVKETDQNEIRRETERLERANANTWESTQQKKKEGAVFGSLSIEDLNARLQETEPAGKPLKLEQKLEDLNGIKPSTPFQFSAVAALMAYGGFKITSYMTDNFAVQLLDSELYPVQRFATFSRNIVVGILTLGTSFSAIICLGLIGLGIAVTSGVWVDFTMISKISPPPPPPPPPPCCSCSSSSCCCSSSCSFSSPLLILHQTPTFKTCIFCNIPVFIYFFTQQAWPMES
jgi:hypothetical protein